MTLKKINTKHSILFGIFMKKRKHIDIYIHNINRFKVLYLDTYWRHKLSERSWRNQQCNKLLNKN